MAVPGFSFGMNDKTSSQGSNNQSTASANVWGQQSPFLQNMFGQGQQLAAQQSGVGQQAQGMVDQFMPGMQQGFQQMGQIGQTGGPIGQFTDPNNPMVNQQLAMLQQSTGDFFNNVLMPGIAGNAVDVGGFGGARQGVAEGAAAGHAMQQFQQGATGIMSNAYNSAQNAAGQQTQAMMGANSAMPGMGIDSFNFGMAPQAAAWSPLQNQAGLLGSPTVLSQSQATGSSFGKSRDSGWNFGLGSS